MIHNRSRQKKLSAQIPHSDFLFEENSIMPNLKSTPKSLMHTETSSEDESPVLFRNIVKPTPRPSIPEFDSPIKLIQANTSAKFRFQETKKNLLKLKLLQRIKCDPIFPVTNPFKFSNSSSKTASTSHGPLNHKLDESLVNLESEEKTPMLQQNW